MTMQRFWKIVERVIDQSDLVIEVIDARMIDTTRNIHAENMAESKQKKLIIAANKSDFIPKELQKEYEKKAGVPLYFVSVRERHGLPALRRGIFAAIGKRTASNSIVGVIGYPNTGKSSLINALCGRHAAAVGSRPGMTRHRQPVRLTEDIRFLDTPGVVPLGNVSEAEQLLMNVLSPSDARRLDLAAEKIVSLYIEKNKAAFEALYKVRTEGKSFHEIVDAIGASNNMITKGSKVDERRVYLKLIDDWQKGKCSKK